MSTALVIFVGWSKPLESRFANKMELFNEITIVWVLYTVTCFSDYVVDPTGRSICGWAFIGVVIFFLAIHILLLIGITCKAVFLSLRLRFLKRKK